MRLFYCIFILLPQDIRRLPESIFYRTDLLNEAVRAVIFLILAVVMQ